MRFINFERTRLPHEILKHNIEEKKRFFAEVNLELERTDAEIQVYVRLHSLNFSPLFLFLLCVFISCIMLVFAAILRYRL